MTFDQFRKKVETAGLHAIDRGRGHWQILCGKLIVNYYPDRGSIYVAGTVRGFFGNTAAAIKAAGTPPDLAGQRSRRRLSYRSAKRRLLKKSRKCNWCAKKLNMVTATLEHIVPLARGGLDNANNWTLACESCNKKRGSDMPEVRDEAK